MQGRLAAKTYVQATEMEAVHGAGYGIDASFKGGGIQPHGVLIAAAHPQGGDRAKDDAFATRRNMVNPSGGEGAPVMPDPRTQPWVRGHQAAMERTPSPVTCGE